MKAMTPGETALNLRKFQKSRKEGLKEPAAGKVLRIHHPGLREAAQ
jgi:hypothetical protein